MPGYLEQLSSWLVEVGKHLEDHARVRAAVAEFATTRSLSTTENRLFRILAPAGLGADPLT